MSIQLRLLWIIAKILNLILLEMKNEYWGNRGVIRGQVRNGFSKKLDEYWQIILLGEKE